MTSRLVFISSDPLNPVIDNLIRALSKEFDILVISDTKLADDAAFTSHYYDYNYSVLDKFFILFFRNIKSPQEVNFVKRNYNRKFRRLINVLFLFKRFADNIFGLPSYSQIMQWRFRRSGARVASFISGSDVVLCDANLRHVYRLAPLVVGARERAGVFISLVYSWDNTHYSSLNNFSDRYLVWNQRNAEELESWHHVSRKQIVQVGSLIHDYLREEGARELLRKSDEVESVPRSVMLYAAVFPMSDVEMAREEVAFLTYIGDACASRIPGFKVLFRPYPSKGPVDILEPLRQKSWIHIHEHKNFASVPRLGNKAETISFEKNKSDKISQFYESSMLLSAGSTYTLEYCFSNRPVLHIDPHVFEAKPEYKGFLERLKVYGHLDAFLSDEYSMNFPKTSEDIVQFFLARERKMYLPYSFHLRSFCSPVEGGFAFEAVQREVRRAFDEAVF